MAYRERAAVGSRGPGVVGEVLAALRGPEGRADPYPLYEQLRTLGPAATGPDGTLVVSGYRECSMLLRDPRLHKTPGEFLTAAGFPDWQERPAMAMMFTSLVMLNPPGHTRLRRLVSSSFTARRVEGLRPAVEQIVAQACEEVAGDSDFVATFAFPLPVAVIGELLGIPASDRPMFQSLAQDWMALADVLTPQVVDRADAAAVIGGYLAELAAERHDHPADDLISAMAVAADGSDALSAGEMVTMAALLLAAGFETTTGLLSNGLVALLAHPDQADRLRTGPALAVPAVEELLRYDSPVQILFGRSAPGDLMVAGLTTVHPAQTLVPGQGRGQGMQARWRAGDRGPSGGKAVCGPRRCPSALAAAAPGGMQSKCPGPALPGTRQGVPDVVAVFPSPRCRDRGGRLPHAWPRAGRACHVPAPDRAHVHLCVHAADRGIRRG